MKVQEKCTSTGMDFRRSSVFPIVMSTYPMVKGSADRVRSPDDFNPVAAEIASLQAEERAVREQFDKARARNP